MEIIYLFPKGPHTSPLPGGFKMQQLLVMKKVIKVVLLLQLLVCYVYALHGKIVFYDGTYVVGKVTKVDESAVYIVPIGLDTAEGVLTGNIDSLKMENGMNN